MANLINSTPERNRHLTASQSFDSSSTLKEMPFSEEDMIAASELREYVYCEKAWSLARQGFAVSFRAKRRRSATPALSFTRNALRMR